MVWNPEKYGILLSQYCDKNFVKATVLLHTQKNADVAKELISRKKNISSALWKLRKFTITLLWQKFCESNDFTKEITKELIWRKKLWGEKIFQFSTLWIAEIYVHTVPSHFFGKNFVKTTF